MSRITILLLTTCCAAPFALAQPAAIIAALKGSATITLPQHNPQPARALDWLPSGTELQTTKNGQMLVAFANGRRFEIGPGAKVSIAADGPGATSGSVRELAKLPPIPKLPVIDALSDAGAMGGIRIRDVASVRLISPLSHMSMLPDHVVLRFEPSGFGGRSTVEVLDRSGQTLFKTETSENQVKVPPQVLHAGQFYTWRVASAAGEVLAQTTFATLGAEVISARTAFKSALLDSDANARLLLAAVDARLGLLEEARDELQTLPAATAQTETAQNLLASLDEAMR